MVTTMIQNQAIEQESANSKSKNETVYAEDCIDDFSFPAAPKTVHGAFVHKPTPPVVDQGRSVEAAGWGFCDRLRRHVFERSLGEDIEMELALKEAIADDVNLEEDEVETKTLLASDPANWKEQDHYAILGLSRLRYKATEDDIKRAYRRKVLKHHPDKTAAEAKGKNKKRSDNFFKCIQKAWEIISDPVKRRQWDSVDPTFDDEIPSSKLKGDFFEVYGTCFESESRFSKIQPVPALGSMDSPREEVEAFYDFWFRFESWRTFEMMDEEDSENAESREEKRWLDRKNRAARQKLKKEDNERITRLVDQALACDPRIRKFKQDEKEAKEAKKREKEAAAMAAQLEAEKKALEEQKAREAAEAEEQARNAQEKKEREAVKNAIRKQKKTIKRIFRDNDQFLGPNPTPDATINHIEKMDYILDHLSLEELDEFRQKLEDAVPGGLDSLLLVFDEQHLAIQESEAEKKAAADAGKASIQEVSKEAAKLPWSPKEINTLIKAVKLFPGGAVARWERIAEYITEHGGEEDETPEIKANRARTPKDCIVQSKQVQSAAAAERSRLQMTAVKPAPKVEIKSDPSVRIEENGQSQTASTTSPPAPSAPAQGGWSNEQQAALEQALKKYPAESFKNNPAERWKKVATQVPGKSLKEVKTRVKELATMAQQKKK